MTPSQTRELLDVFAGKPVNDDVLKAYCERHKLQVITVERFNELMVQDSYDAKLERFLPTLLTLLAQYQFIRDYISDADKKAKLEANDKLETQACKLMEDCDFTVDELDSLPRDLQNILQLFGVNSLARVNNMVKTMLRFTAAVKYGEPLSIKALGEGYREAALELGKKEGKE